MFNFKKVQQFAFFLKTKMAPFFLKKNYADVNQFYILHVKDRKDCLQFSQNTLKNFISGVSRINLLLSTETIFKTQKFYAPVIPNFLVVYVSILPNEFPL